MHDEQVESEDAEEDGGPDPWSQRLAADETGGGPRRVAGLDALGPASEWALSRVANRTFAIGAGEGGRLAVTGDDGRLVLGGSNGGEARRTFTFLPAGG